MTRQQQHKIECPNCKHEVETATPFSQWLRQLEAPLDSRHCDCQNLDFIWFHYGPGWFITIEEKRFGAQPSQAQSDTHNIIAQLLKLSSGSAVKTMRGERPIHYRGHFVVSFEKTTPLDSGWVSVNGARYMKPIATVKNLLNTGNVDGKTITILPPVVAPDKSGVTDREVHDWVLAQPVARLIKFVQWICEVLSQKTSKAA